MAGHHPGRMAKGRRFMRFVSRAAAIGLVLVAALFVGSGWLIGSGVHAASQAALLEQPGDPVPALMAYVESPKHTFRDRDRAVWALGQLGDRCATVGTARSGAPPVRGKGGRLPPIWFAVTRTFFRPD